MKFQTTGSFRTYVLQPLENHNGIPVEYWLLIDMELALEIQWKYSIDFGKPVEYSSGNGVPVNIPTCGIFQSLEFHENAHWNPSAYPEWSSE